MALTETNSTATLNKEKKTCCSSTKKFIKNMRNFLAECKTPPSSDFAQILRGHVFGVVLLGVFAYIIKVIHIPINNMILGTENK